MLTGKEVEVEVKKTGKIQDIKDYIYRNTGNWSIINHLGVRGAKRKKFNSFDGPAKKIMCGQFKVELKGIPSVLRLFRSE